MQLKIQIPVSLYWYNAFNKYRYKAHNSILILAYRLYTHNKFSRVVTQVTCNIATNLLPMRQYAVTLFSWTDYSGCS